MIKKIEIVVCICENCSNVWMPKQKDILPKACPEPTCHSTHWNDKGEIKDEMLSIPKYITDRIDKIREYIDNVETYKEKKVLQDEAVASLKGYMSEDDARKFVPILTIVSDRKGNIEVILRELKENLNDNNYITELTSELDRQLLREKLTRNDIVYMIKKEDLEKVLLAENKDEKVEKTISAARKANITVILEYIKNNLDDSNYITTLISSLDDQLSHNKLTRNDIAYMIKNVGLENILLAENKYTNADITLYKETQKRLDNYKKQTPKLEARRDELLLIKERTNDEIDELRDTKNELEKLSRIEIGDNEQLNKLKEKCPNIEDCDKL